MADNQTIEALCAAYKNEDVHSRHVARLALTLFDAVYPYVKIPAGLRPLLRAAALLHDIGYGENPLDHQAESAWIIVKKGIAGFTDEQCGTIAATVLLHRKDYAKAFSFPLFKDLETKETALKLGAILRIADGLDHGHVQNLEILSVKPAGGGFLCACSSPGYRGNIPWAQAKADLWKRVFSCDFCLTDRTPAIAGHKYKGIVRPDDTVLDAARRLMILQYRIIAENYNGMLAAKSEEPLHDARIAIRRLRSVLRLFRRFLPASSRGIDRRLADLALALSPLRDNDVWIGFLSDHRLSRSFAGAIDFVHFYAQQSRMRKVDRQTLAGILKSNEYGGLMREVSRLLRVELPQRIRAASPQPLAPFASRKLLSVFFEALGRPGVKKRYDVGEMHALRKLCRRGRYWAEFMEPLLGRPATIFARHFKALADTLGDLHDTDTALQRISHDTHAVTEKVRHVLNGDKKRQERRFRVAWRLFRSPPMHQAAAALFKESCNGNAILYCVRHATAIDGSDASRPLSQGGQREAELLGRAFPLIACPPHTIASSMLKRAVSTAERIALGLSPGLAVRIARKRCLMPSSGTGGTLQWLADSMPRSCICVGHQPHLSRLVASLAAMGESDVPDLKRGSVCCIFFPTGKIEKAAGEIEWYFPQKKLKRIVKRWAG